MPFWETAKASDFEPGGCFSRDDDDDRDQNNNDRDNDSESSQEDD